MAETYGTLRQPQAVSWADNDETLDPSDPVALTSRQLAAAGGIDSSQPAGSIRNPRGLRTEDDEQYVKPNEYFIDRVGRVRQGTVPVAAVDGEIGTTGRMPSPASPLTRSVAELQYLLNPSEKSRVAAIGKAYPNATFGRAGDGRVVVQIPGGEGWQYLNAPGFSGQDALDIGAQGVQFAPAGAAARGATTALRAGSRVGGVSAAISAAQDIATGQPIDVPKAALAGVGGVGGEYVGLGLGALGRSGVRVAESVAPAPIKGVLSDLSDHLGSGYGRDAALSRGATRMGIPISRGEMTGDFGQIAFEQAAARGARGEEAGRIMRGLYDERTGALRNTGRGLAGSETVGSIPDAGAVVQQGMRDRAVSAKGGVDSAYGALRSSDATISAPTINELPGRIRTALEDDFFSPDVMTSLNPRTQRIFAEMDRLAGSAPTISGDVRQTARALAEDVWAGKITPEQAESLVGSKAAGAVDPGYSLPVAGVERMRQAISSAMSGAQGNDRAALQIMKREFDDWLGDAVDNALINGDPAAIETLKKARALHRDYRQTFGGGKKDDAAQRMMQKLIAADANETDAVNLLFGRAELSGAGPSVELVKRMKKVAPGAPEVKALREGAVMRLMSRLERNAGAGSTNVNPKALADDWTKALDGPGGPLMRELFTADELANMREFVSVLRSITPPEGSVNRSGSGYEVARAVQGVFSKLKIIAPFAKAIDDAANAARAQGAASPDVLRAGATRLPQAAPAAGALGAYQVQERAPF